MNSIFNPDDIYDIELELTTYCNAGCPLCYRNYKTFKDHYPKYIIRPLEEVKKDIDQFKNLNFIKLVGSISEPTIYKDFLELVKYIKSDLFPVLEPENVLSNLSNLFFEP